MDIKSIMRIVKKASMVYHTTMVYIRYPDNTVKPSYIEFYEYKQTDDECFLYGYDINKKEYKTIQISSIVDVSDTEKSFTPKHSCHTILDFGE